MGVTIKNSETNTRSSKKTVDTSKAVEVTAKVLLKFYIVYRNTKKVCLKVNKFSKNKLRLVSASLSTKKEVLKKDFSEKKIVAGKLIKEKKVVLKEDFEKKKVAVNKIMKEKQHQKEIDNKIRHEKKIKQAREKEINDKIKQQEKIKQAHEKEINDKIKQQEKIKQAHEKEIEKNKQLELKLIKEEQHKKEKAQRLQEKERQNIIKIAKCEEEKKQRKLEKERQHNIKIAKQEQEEKQRKLEKERQNSIKQARQEEKLVIKEAKLAKQQEEKLALKEAKLAIKEQEENQRKLEKERQNSIKLAKQEEKIAIKEAKLAKQQQEKQKIQEKEKQRKERLAKKDEEKRQNKQKQNDNKNVYGGYALSPKVSYMSQNDGTEPNVRVLESGVCVVEKDLHWESIFDVAEEKKVTERKITTNVSKNERAEYIVNVIKMTELCLLIVALCTTLCFVGYKAVSAVGKYVFSQEKWQEYPNDRIKMVDNLEEKYNFEGMDKSEIENVLGIADIHLTNEECEYLVLNDYDYAIVEEYTLNAKSKSLTDLIPKNYAIAYDENGKAVWADIVMAD